MRRILVPLSFLWALTACGGSFEGACKDICDKIAECGSQPPAAADLLKCKNDCEETEAEGQSMIQAGTLSQACYDATRDVLSCASGLSCVELRQSSLPAACKEVADDYGVACGQ